MAKDRPLAGLSPQRVLRLVCGWDGTDAGWPEAWSVHGSGREPHEAGARRYRRALDALEVGDGHEPVAWWRRLAAKAWERQDALRDRLRCEGGYAAHEAAMDALAPGEAWPGLPAGSRPGTYEVWGMLVRTCAMSGGRLYATRYPGDVERFAEDALAAWQELRCPYGDDYKATGRWLERMVLKGCHPLDVAEGLDRAWKAGLLRRYTEGSTPETRYPQRYVYALARRATLPGVERLPLDHEEILIEGRAATGVRVVPA